MQRNERSEYIGHGYERSKACGNGGLPDKKTMDYVEIGMDAEDYYRIKNSETP